MKRIAGLLMIVGLLAFLFAAAPPAFAACSDPAGPGVDWSGCTKIGVNLSNADLSGANLTGANLSSGNFTNTNFSNAQIDGLDLSNGYLFQTNFTGAEGTPLTANTFFFGVTCPDGTTNQTSCEWRPAAVTLGQTSATAVAPGAWPLALFGLLLLGTAGALLLRRDARPLAA